ncbi:hypothetical protein ACKKBG_A34310 [Auxenochlorella protothecoides x Auxenochlorella symbiontica]|nr:hypothetical protein F751_2434 [Auxenochlorella protothecoides]KFM25592.1 hypothetical protein F751_2434 [Auxenochlorella protothecoides]RMZ52567.1 hypothetical protein APUTEX25_003710 [Auxenochlorella protothecoides]|eukprot:RMZ52567.1 hypothetical protein APUTEX25_003710 [Auxenochlorella protothecoides]
MTQDPIKLVLVGDVHGDWDEDSATAARHLEPDAVLFLGDFGNEDVALVRSLAALDLPKAFILGNHDAMFSLSGRGKEYYVKRILQKSTLGPFCSDPGSGASPNVALQLEALGSMHLGYASATMADGRLSVVGARPFSQGGAMDDHVTDFYQRHYDVDSMSMSAQRIVETAERQHEAAPHLPLVLIAHNGPSGLGGRPEDPCGVDWRPGGGDHGDADLEAALRELCARGRPPTLVAYGHMHEELHHSVRRERPGVKRERVAVAHGAVFLNAAVVPRIVRLPGAGARTHHFVEVRLAPPGGVLSAADVLVEVARGGGVLGVQRQPLLTTTAVDAEGGARRTRILHTSTGEWEDLG